MSKEGKVQVHLVHYMQKVNKCSRGKGNMVEEEGQGDSLGHFELDSDPLIRAFLVLQMQTFYHHK